MTFDEQLYEQKYKSDPNEAKRYLQTCIEAVREEAKNSSSNSASASSSGRRMSEFDVGKYSEMWARSPMLAADYLNRYIDLVRRKAAVIDAKVNFEDSMTATAGFAAPPPQKNPAEMPTEKLPAHEPEEPLPSSPQPQESPGGWRKLKKLLFGK